jgi:hypothetical protein
MKVTWTEPLGSGKYGYTCTADAKDIIAFMQEEYQTQYKNHPEYPYKTDQQALEDFLAINWATLE